MTIDAVLALLHHVTAFALVAILFAECCLMAHLQVKGLQMLARLDLAYGGMAGGLFVFGVARLIWGSKGWAFYVENPVFWLKLVCFAFIGLLSIVPTLRILKWRKSGLPEVGALQRTRYWMVAQLLLIPLVLLFASLMARGIGL